MILTERCIPSNPFCVYISVYCCLAAFRTTSRIACFLLLFVFPRQYSKVLRFVLRAIFFLFGFHRIKVKGQKAEVDEAPIVCIAPHSSLFDAFVFLLGPGLGSGVSREGNATVLLIGRMYYRTTVFTVILFLSWVFLSFLSFFVCFCCTFCITKCSWVSVSFPFTAEPAACVRISL